MIINSPDRLSLNRDRVGPCWLCTMKAPLAGNLGFAPRLTRILNSISDADCSHNHYSLRHPADIFASVLSDVVQNFLGLLKTVLPLEQPTQSSPEPNKESIRLYKDLLASFARYIDCSYEVILALCDKRPIADGERKDLYKWLKKERFQAAVVYYGIIKPDTAYFRDVNNTLKHSSNTLRSVTVLINSRPCLGYFIEGASTDGTVGPSEIFHKGVNGQVTANSFNRDLRRLYYCTYLVSDALRRAVAVHYKALHNRDPLDDLNTRYDDTQFKELFDKVSSLPLVYYSKEAGKLVPVATITQEKDGPTIVFTDSKAPTPYGGFSASVEGVVARSHKYKVSLP
jgi:hypothetical protein